MPLRRKGNEGKGVGDLPPPITSKIRIEFASFICQENIDGRTFKQYLTYHFNYWMASGPSKFAHSGVLRLLGGMSDWWLSPLAGGISAMFQLLVIGILTLLTLGSALGCFLM